MLTKFEKTTGRVKGLSFHSKRPWILVSLHSGVIQIWDYRMGTPIDEFIEHKGPVRGVHFHKSQPLFVSGGDDCKIKVWNYKMCRCLFTLLGHYDYIRTVQFHHEHPWIVSASDDQTIRIWNWQSRTCVSVLTGHNHYVMSASFHPKEDLVVSASLDLTVRVWDISALKKQTASRADDILRLSQMNTELFGGVDVVVKYVLEGHDRGVNWAAFHPNLPLIVSGSDDRQVKLWRTNDTKAWEVDTLRGHTNNVSCVIFHAKQDIILSNSEDKSIRVWDATKRTGLQTFRREHDRFWTLIAHPEMNLLAAGHDSGIIVFKLESERPAFALSGDAFFYTTDRFLRLYEFSSQRDALILATRRPGSTGLNQNPRTLSFSPKEDALLICSDVDGGSYELYRIPRDVMLRGDSAPDVKRGTGGSALFVARNRFAVLERRSKEVLIKNLNNEIVKKSELPSPADTIFYAGPYRLLCRTEEGVYIFDLQQRLVLGALSNQFIKYVVWSNDMERVALLSKYKIIIASKNLNSLCTLREKINVKSGAWDENGVFIYTTLNHIKYFLPDGDSGIIKTLDVPMYITKVSGNSVFCLDRDGKTRAIIIDPTEYMFKMSLLQKRYDHVISMIRNSQLCGQAMTAYLQQKGFPEVGLHFVKDEKTRFNLALESGNIEIAVASAKEIDEKDHWYRLGVGALCQGNSRIVEYAYQRTKNFNRLSFLYLITGNMDKLTKMLKISEVQNDIMGQFQNALYLGDVCERVKILENSRQLPLAYVTASVHGLHDVAERLALELGENLPALPSGKHSSLLIPPRPVISAADWPLLRVMRGIFEGGLDHSALEGYEDEAYEAANGDWVEELDMVEMDHVVNGDLAATLEDGEVAEGNGEEEEEGGWDIEDLELPPELETPRASSVNDSSNFVAPTPGIPVSQMWIQRSSLAAEQVAAGNYDTAMRLLSRQLGIRNFAPLRQIFLNLHWGSHSYMRGFPSAPILSLALERGWAESSSHSVRGPPALVYSFSQLEEKLTAAYHTMKAGKLTESLRLFLEILHTIPLTVVDSRSEVDEVKELVGIVKEYILGIKMEQAKREMKNDPVRQMELAAYFTHLNLQTVHLRRALESAMTCCFNNKNFATAGIFAQRLLDTNPTAEPQLKKARQVLAASERNNTDASVLNYDYRNPFAVCGGTYVPIYCGQKFVSCPYCCSRFIPSQEGQVCNICDLSLVGADASGLLCSPSQVR